MGRLRRTQRKSNLTPRRTAGAAEDQRRNVSYSCVPSRSRPAEEDRTEAMCLIRQLFACGYTSSGVERSASAEHMLSISVRSTVRHKTCGYAAFPPTEPLEFSRLECGPRAARGRRRENEHMAECVYAER